MSEDEMTEQKVRLQMDIEKTERQLAALREATNTYADFFYRIAVTLKSSPDSITAEALQDSPLDILPILEVVEAIRREDTRLAELKERLGKLR